MAASPRLTRALHQQLGDELSSELVTWMGRMDSSRTELSAFRSDFTDFVGTTSRRFDALEGRFSALEGRFSALETRLMTFEAKLDTKLGLLEARSDRLETKFDALYALTEKRQADLMKWIFTCWCGSVFAIAALVLAGR